MGSRTKNKHKVSFDNKLEVEEWHKFREDIDELRQFMSWRQISIAVGRNVGWAVKAYEHRGLVDDRGAADIRHLVLVERRKRQSQDLGVIRTVGERRDTHDRVTPGAIAAIEQGAVQQAPTAREQEKLAELKVPTGEHQKLEWFQAVVFELRRLRRMSLDEIGAVFGYGGQHPGNSVSSATQGNHVPKQWRLERACEILRELRAGRFAEAEKLMQKPAPIHKETETVGQQKYVDRPLDRIGPEAKPPRTVTRAAPVPPPAPPPPPAPEPPQLEPAQVKPAAAAPAKNGTHPNPLSREERLNRLKDRLMQVAVEDFEEMLKSEPKFVQPAWRAKQGELITFIESLE